MDNLPSSALGAINRGASAFYEGRLEDARVLFVHALHLDPDSEPAWLWLATVSDDPAEQRYCLYRALEINPESTGLERLARLPAGPTTVPADIVDLKQPPLPPDLAQVSGVPMPLLPRGTAERRKRARASRPPRGRHACVETGETAEPTAAHERPWRWRRWLLVVVGLALILAVIVASLLQRAAGPAGDHVVIAFAGPLSGPDAASGQEQLNAVQMAVNALNDRGGIAGQSVHVLSFDDQNDPQLAEQRAREIAANDQVLLVIGHDRSDASMAAAPIYAAAGIPAISPSSTADALTEDSSWYFRSIFTNHAEGELIAAYTLHALLHDRASVISTTNHYESTLAEAFVRRFEQEGTVAAQWLIDPDDPEGSIATIIAELKATDDPGVLFLALQPAEAEKLLLALGHAGLTPEMIGGEALGFEDFTERFAHEPEASQQPGFFSNGLYVASPLIYDSLGGNALAFAQRYQQIYGRSPEWFGAKAHDAAMLALHALDVASNDNAGEENLAARRQQIRDALTATNSIATSIPGLSGPLYFDATRSVPQALSFGKFDLGTLFSAPIQYRAVTDPALFDLEADRAAGLLFEIDGQTFRQYRVAYVGVDINEISSLDARAQTFDADFFLWFRYQGDPSAENVFFPNATDPETAMPEPLDRQEVNGQQFAMYRIHRTFTNPLNFEDYPWDKHLLTLNMQNLALSQNDIVYVPDQANLHQSQAERLQSGADLNQPFNRIPSWIVGRVFYAQDSATVRSTTPDPRTGAPEYEQVSTYEVQMSYGRDVLGFLIKNVLPLALLGLVTYISLYFSPANATPRITFSVSTVLTASVMLQSVSNNLPEIGYTVAIEWGYYVFIGLSAVVVMTNITIDRWYKTKRYVAVKQLDRLARILYPVALLIVVAVYAYRFG